MTDIEKQINGITRRINDNKRTQNNIPGELIQCVVFYSVPTADYLGIKPGLFTPKSIKNSVFVFPYYSKEIFTDQKSAEIFLPHFISRLVKEKKLPENVNDLIKSGQIKTAVAPLTITLLEREDEAGKTMEKSEFQAL